MTLDQIHALLGDPQQMAAMDHASLYQAREGADPKAQALLALYEHRAFAREATRENPLMALPIAAGALAYQPYKMVMGQSRSAPSLGQVGQGLFGVGEGLVGAGSDLRDKVARALGI